MIALQAPALPAMRQAAETATPASRPHFSRYAIAIYAALHLSCLGVFYTGVTPTALRVFAAAFVIRSVGVSIVYHRYLAHRAFRTSRVMQFLLTLYGTFTTLGGPLWWASTHRRHHQHADTPQDLHSPHFQGFLYAHCGWFLDNRYRRADLANVMDLAVFPEILWLDRLSMLLKALYVALAVWWFGAIGYVWGFALPAVLVLQMVHWIQSVSHSIGGYRRYPTPDDSRNHFLFALLSMGEGFHHNHHRFPYSARLGLAWWEFDAGYVLLRVLEKMKLVWDIREPGAAAAQGRTATDERSVRDMNADMTRLIDRLGTALSVSGEQADIVRRAIGRLQEFRASLRALLIEGPAHLRRAEDRLRLSLLQDLRRAFADQDPRLLQAESILNQPWTRASHLWSQAGMP